MAFRIWGRNAQKECRHHWHGETGNWRCCWCPEISGNIKPVRRTAACWFYESFTAGELALPPARRIAGRRKQRHRAA